MSEGRLSREQQALVERVAPRVVEIARAVRSQVGTLPVEEFESAGYEALVKAALRYDPAAGVPFQGFAYLRIRGAMIDALRAANPTIRRQKRAMRALEATQALYEEEAKNAPRGADPRTLKERVEAAAELIRQTTSAVLLSRMTPEDPETTHDEASTPADEAVIRAELHDHLDRAVGRCADDERALIDALYHRDLNMHAYAAELGVSVSTVSRRHARLLRKLGTLMPDATGPP
ncbi:MAG: sigma-70 family RNA polymerase sigma factor [Myxococcales bacterium]|nr:sigma-70 family RNA polymerase sigma factor [Myxococcales bacterium]